MTTLLKSPRTLGLTLLLTLGILRLPIENHLSHQLRQQNLIPSPPDLTLIEALGQTGFATLGGLRSLAASIFYLQAYVAFEHLEWGKVDSLMSLTTRLQPQEDLYWDDAAWHMAYNAASSYLNNQQIRAAMRQKLFKDHVQRGINILTEGLQYLPNNPRLHIKLGDIYNSNAPTSRAPNPRKAAQHYLAAHTNGAPPYYQRIAAYQLAQLNDTHSLQQAYHILKQHHQNNNTTPTMRTIIPELEQKLHIPTTQKLNLTTPTTPKTHQK